MPEHVRKGIVSGICCIIFLLTTTGAVTADTGWVKLLGSVADEGGYGVTIDASGAIYIAGATQDDLGGQTSAGGQDSVIAKYDANGTPQWVRLLGSSVGDTGRAVAVDTTGNVYVTGETYGDLNGETNAGGTDLFVAKYTAAGGREWVKLLGTTGYDYGNGIAVDPSGDVYVTGATEGKLDGQPNAGERDILVAKYTAAGVKQWVKLVGSAGHDYGHDIAVDTAGHIYVTGQAAGDMAGETSAGGIDIVIARYTAAGVREWLKLLGTVDNDFGHGIAVDSSGAVYITGETLGNLAGQTNAGCYDIVIAKYTAAGAEQWVTLLGSTGWDYGYGISAGSSGTIDVTGYTYGDLDGETNAGDVDILVARYTAAGIKQWVRLLGTVDTDQGMGIVTDSSGNIYTVGYTNGDLGGQPNAGEYDMFVWKLVQVEPFPWEIFYPAIMKKRQSGE